MSYTRLIPAIAKPGLAAEDDPTGKGIYLHDFQSPRREITDQAAMENTLMHCSYVKTQQAEGTTPVDVLYNSAAGEFWFGSTEPVRHAPAPVLGGVPALQGSPVGEAVEASAPVGWSLPPTPGAQAPSLESLLDQGEYTVERDLGMEIDLLADKMNTVERGLVQVLQILKGQG